MDAFVCKMLFSAIVGTLLADVRMVGDVQARAIEALQFSNRAISIHNNPTAIARNI